jgi:hypothetical protein
MSKRTYTWRTLSILLLAGVGGIVVAFCNLRSRDSGPVEEKSANDHVAHSAGEIGNEPSAGESGGVVDSPLSGGVSDVSPASHVSELTALLATRKNVLVSLGRLKELALAGDDAAALQIFDDLRLCGLSESRGKILEDLAVTSLPPLQDEAVEYAVTASEQDFEKCAGLDSTELASKFDWLALAARRGSVAAKSQFYVYALEQFDTPQELVANAQRVDALKTEAIRHLSDAAAAGKPESMMALFDEYQRGVIVDRNAELAYTYARLLERRGLLKPNTLAYLHTQMSQLRSELTAVQIEGAEQRSEALYRRCCG